MHRSTGISCSIVFVALATVLILGASAVGAYDGHRAMADFSWTRTVAGFEWGRAMADFSWTRTMADFEWVRALADFSWTRS